MPRLLAAPAQLGQGQRAMSTARAWGPSSADSLNAAQVGTPGPQRKAQWQPSWMPRIYPWTSASSVLTRLGLRRHDGQAELDKLVGERAPRERDSNASESLPQPRQDEIASSSATMPAWQRATHSAASAARQLQAALLGFHPFPPRAHFGSHTYLLPAPANARRNRVAEAADPQSPAQR